MMPTHPASIRRIAAFTPAYILRTIRDVALYVRHKARTRARNFKAGRDSLVAALFVAPSAQEAR
ncbi:hypothetical protein FHI69_03025 [Janthinobacterium lividum]|uniref:Uncharacterized protein n=1 Tax=Janthinobacterium lividum TaxID=29581 RepID=A0A5C4NTP6_9BURK|nr:hypothetical protein [Janthinobacterium lividum]TNC78281.1 hypothetical protein FHI69_03025 [Janthinobacterium lividum]